MSEGVAVGKSRLDKIYLTQQPKPKLDQNFRIWVWDISGIGCIRVKPHDSSFFALSLGFSRETLTQPEFPDTQYINKLKLRSKNYLSIFSRLNHAFL